MLFLVQRGELLMDQKKIGEYIKKLRESEELTQEELAKDLAVTRQAISKWETGVNMPDTETLKKLSDLFNISIEKLIDGGETQEKISVSKNYKELTSKAIDDNIMLKQTIKRRTKTMIIISTIALIVLLILFLTYYFANSYGKTHIYKIYGFSDNYEITNGLFIRNTERSYFNLGTITVKNEVEPDIKELYYIKDDQERLIIKGSINSVLQENYGYDEYFPVDDMNIILDNLYVRLYKGNKEIDNLKLTLQEDYVNNKLFFRKTEKISNEDQATVEIENPERDELIEK